MNIFLQCVYIYIYTEKERVNCVSIEEREQGAKEKNPNKTTATNADTFYNYLF